MKLQATALSIALLFGATAFAQNAPAPAAPAAPAVPIDFMNRTQTPLGQKFAAALEENIKGLDGVSVVEGLATKDDSTRPEIRVMARQLNDKETLTIVVVTVHNQGKQVSAYVGTLGDVITEADYKDAAAAALENIGQALAMMEPYLEEDAGGPPAEQKQQKQSSAPRVDTTVLI